MPAGEWTDPNYAIPGWRVLGPDEPPRSRLGVAPADMTKALEEKGIRLDTLRKRLRSDVARERLARMPSHDYEDRLDHPLIPKM